MMFLDDEDNWTIWGVHSWGDQNCAILSGSTRTDLFAEWIVDQIEAEYGTRDVCEVNEWYDDGTCDVCDEPDPDCAPEGDDDDSAGDDDDGPADDDGDACAGCGAEVGSQPTGSGALLLGLFSVLGGARRARGSRGSRPS
jgi:hypothetical protein